MSATAIDIYTKAVIDIAGYYDQAMGIPGTKEPHPRVAALSKWMRDYIPGDAVGAFVEMVQKKFTWFPKIAELEKLKNGNSELRAEQAWQMMIPKSSGDDVLITDPAACFVVAGFGSWHDFCIERDMNREWTHKSFIERYVAFCESGVDYEPRVLTGSWKHHYGASFKLARGVQIIGDSELGKKLLTSTPVERPQIENLASSCFKRAEA